MTGSRELPIEDHRPGDAGANPPHPRAVAPQVCCDDPWEEAYLRFESPEQEIAKFVTRLEHLGAPSWPREAAIVELFCGRGNGLRALDRMGFARVEGVDLSATLLGRYDGPARCHVGDCRRLDFFADGSKDFVIIQGGLHHLPVLPDDLDQTLAEVRRVLRGDGRVVIVEPWLTPFLRLVHHVCDRKVARALLPRIDALATMIDHERSTYEAWLGRPTMVLGTLDRHFTRVVCRTAWGKLQYVGRRRER